MEKEKIHAEKNILQKIALIKSYIKMWNNKQHPKYVAYVVQNCPGNIKTKDYMMEVLELTMHWPSKNTSIHSNIILTDDNDNKLPPKHIIIHYIIILIDDDDANNDTKVKCL